MNPEAVFSIQNDTQFESEALRIFELQYQNNPVYRRFCELIGREVASVKGLNDIPFIPIEFFKSQEILTGNDPVEQVFTSSGTTGTATSRHLVTDLKIYEESFNRGYAYFYGDIKEYVVLALLPSYLERTGSSLIYMVDALIRSSGDPDSGFYLHNLDDLAAKLKVLDRSGKKVLLIGVSFALLDLVESFNFQLNKTIIMETGGMKGRRKELIREELHNILKKGFGVDHIHSEYGMTELLSQAYSTGDGTFSCPPWMKVKIRDTGDPFTWLPEGRTGGISVIDLANINSCSFIATQDLGKLLPDGRLEILGRFDNSDIRGCNLLVT
ncbi:acyl transferase [Robertkochia solimangrovi]|uniref:LuxE/PaaK family acyltransferase n=1 Tax=Robertkochia solimangrovi TaxID=2213046 RepID=UPI00117C6CCF|nr:acyl transferase [Robertkochia solimangrovi]TRZ43314.1 acyl transferase [Robertkochia solimangrovi]